MKVHTVEQRTPEWYTLRAGMPTASEFGKVVTTKGELSKSAEVYARTLAIELYTGGNAESFQGNDWTDRGAAMEDEALAFYAFMYSANTERVGFVTDDAETHGCSPDALVDADGMIEIKCLKPENHIEVMEFYKRNQRCPAKYVQQTQGQLMICDRAWCDLVFYAPLLPPVVIRQEPDTEFQTALIDALADLIKQRDATLHLIQEFQTLESEAA